MAFARDLSLTFQACGRASQGSNRETHFYELDIQVKGSPALDHSLVGSLMMCARHTAVLHTFQTVHMHLYLLWSA